MYIGVTTAVLPLTVPIIPDVYCAGAKQYLDTSIMTSQILNCDVVEGLRQIPDHTVSMAVTSPPYYGLRSYGIEPRQWDDGTLCVLGD